MMHFREQCRTETQGKALNIDTKTFRRNEMALLMNKDQNAENRNEDHHALNIS